MLGRPKVVLVESGLRPTYDLLKKNGFDAILIKSRFVPTNISGSLYIFHLKDGYFLKTFQKAAEIIKQRLPEAKVMFAGPFANNHPREVLFGSVGDYVCVGDDSETILELCQKWEAQDFPKGLYRGE